MIQIIQNRIKRPNQVRPWFLPLIGLVFLAATLGSVHTGGCAEASSNSPSSYCYRIEITALNESGGVLTDTGARGTMPTGSLVGSGQLQPDGMDFRPTAGGFSNEQIVWAQDLNEPSAAWWFRVDSLAAGASKTFRLYTGNSEVQRNNGIFFTGLDSVTVTDHNDLDVTDQLALEATVTLLSSTPQDASIIDKWDNNGGYALELVEIGSTQYLRIRIDTASQDIAWQSSWTENPTKFRVEFDTAKAQDLWVYVNGTNISKTELGLSSITSNAEDLAIGAGLDSAVIHRVKVSDQILTNENTIGRWSFTADSCTETVSSDPTFQGNCTDSSGNDHTAAYSFTRPQSGSLSVTTGAIALTSAPLLLTAADWTADLVGDPLSTNMFVEGGLQENTRWPFATGLTRFVDDMPFPRQASWFFIFGFMSCMFALLFWAFIPTTEAALVGSVIPMFIAVGFQLIEPWYLTLWVLTAVAMWQGPKFIRGF